MHQNLTLIVRDGWNQRVPGWRDLFAILLVLTVVILLGSGARQMLQPFAVAHQPEISLSVSALPNYALRTIMRMLAALLASLLFTFLYATLAAKSRRAEMVLIPILDVLQSVPVLGYLSFTTVFFIALFPGNVMGPELAAIFAIFTSQAWNMTFSFYESLRMIPNDLDEASRSFRFSGWQRFWRLEVPFAMPGLIWNMMMSMSGGWFFVVASEAITVGTLQVTLPGIGSYVATAIAHRDLQAIGWAIVAMSITILMYDQLLFRPLVAWAEKFRFEQTSAQVNAKSWLISLIRSTRFLHPLAAHFTHALQRVGRARLSWIDNIPALTRPTGSRHIIDRLWLTSVLLGLAYGLWLLLHYFKNEVSMNDLLVVFQAGLLTLTRVVILIIIASLIWVPIGVAVGLRPRWAQIVQPFAQFLAAFPANLMFPIAVFLILHYDANPRIWLSPLMILGTQWYILFNVIAGVSTFPNDLLESARSFRIKGWRWWRDVMLPGILPYYVTGAITASGGAWNASIVSEVVNWGPTRLNGSGLGAYIANMTETGNYPHIALGITLMSLFVIAMNRLLWRPLYAFAERRTKLD
ncbi:ABC transporter permease [Undibacterium sp. SXout11W]|uniref:ABC transporter permease n=1 Tax=Undibacterium sp. SXout11W TaxID=3413050 RepID=UPI003BF124D1